MPLDMVIFGDTMVFADHSEPQVSELPEGYYDRARLEKELFPYLFSDRRSGFHLSYLIQFHVWDKVCRSELQKKNHVRDENISMYEDVPLTAACLLDSQNIYISSEMLYYYNKANPGSIMTLGGKNRLNKSVAHVVAYLQARLRGISPQLDQQLNDYPAHMVITTGIAQLENSRSFFQAVRKVKAGLKDSVMLHYISLRMLPPKPRLCIFLFKCHLNYAAMLLCALKMPKKKQ